MSAQTESVAAIAGSGNLGERERVVQVIHEYLRVTDYRDKLAIAKSFHPTAVLNSVTGTGSLKSMTQDEWWERVSRIPPATQVRQSKFTLVEVVGVAAVARVDITDEKGNSSSDLFTLQRTSNGWRIVNKVLSTPL